MGNEGSESLTDAEAVNNIMETRHKIIKEFREAETRKKLKDCQGIRVRKYQHQRNYIAGDKIWFQHKDGNAWHGPAEVVYQKGNIIFVYNNGELCKVAMCRAQPYELIEKTQEETEASNEQENTPEIIEEDSEVENDEKTEDSETDVEAVNRIMETRSKVTQQFREAETRKKLKDCQKSQ